MLQNKGVVIYEIRNNANTEKSELGYRHNDDGVERVELEESLKEIRYLLEGEALQKNNNKGGERKMSEVNDILSNLSSFIICGYTLIKSIIAIVSKIKSKN